MRDLSHEISNIVIKQTSLQSENTTTVEWTSCKYRIQPENEQKLPLELKKKKEKKNPPIILY